MGAWIETVYTILHAYLDFVAPLWERGLKLLYCTYRPPPGPVAPLWERGLKLVDSDGSFVGDSVAPLWERGLKP